MVKNLKLLVAAQPHNLLQNQLLSQFLSLPQKNNQLLVSTLAIKEALLLEILEENTNKTLEDNTFKIKVVNTLKILKASMLKMQVDYTQEIREENI